MPPLVAHRLSPRPALLVAALLAAGCGGAADHASPVRTATAATAAPAPPARTTIYLLSEGGTAPLGVRRDLTRRRATSTARLALEALLAGPSKGEHGRGLTTAIPPAARVRSLTIESKASGSDAFVDLSGLPPADNTGAVRKVRVMTQIARTLIGLSDIERVWLRADGGAWGLWDHQGNIRDDPIDYDRLRGFFHICAAKPGTEAVPGDCFTALP